MEFGKKVVWFGNFVNFGNFLYRISEVVYVHDKRKPVEKRLGLNLMINMLSQSTHSNGGKQLAKWVYHLTEVLIITGEHTVPSKTMVKRLLMNYKNSYIEQVHLRKLIALLSNDVFLMSFQ